MLRRVGVALVATVALSPVAAVAETGPGGGAPGNTSEVAPVSAATGGTAKPSGRAVLRTRVIGRSVQGRAILAHRLGERARRGVPTVVLIATMHGNESHTRQILHSLMSHRPVIGVNLWVVPTYNPDGLARGTRKNAHGVDLNRNFPHHWVDLDGNYESGRGPASEPETRAMMGFLRSVRPDRILSFHQPLYGVDTDTKKPRFARRVADRLHLPRRSLTCGGVCHGTMTSWYNSNFAGVALTVEYGASPPRRLMRTVAPRQVLSVFGATRGDVGFEPARPR